MSNPDEMMFEVPLSRLNELTEEIRSLHQELRDRDRADKAQEERTHDHRWKVVGINRPPEDMQPVHPRHILNMTQIYTYVLLRCVECRWMVSLQLVGNWTENQIRDIDPVRGHYGDDTTADS